jgi:maleate isomerase
VGMPTIDVLDSLERDLGKPVVSSIAATMWNALRGAGVHAPIEGFGSLLAQRPFRPPASNNGGTI